MSPRKISRGLRTEFTMAQVRLAEHRTEFLLELAAGRTVRDTVANAWLQGVLDAGEALPLLSARAALDHGSRGT